MTQALACALGDVLGAEVAALHVQVGSARTPCAVAEAAGVPLSVVRGGVVERLVAAGGAEDIAALVIGARGIPGDPRPLGTTAVAIATTGLKPVVGRRASRAIGPVRQGRWTRLRCSMGLGSGRP